MPGFRKWIGIAALAAFVFLAGSVVCLASGMPVAMTDCGNSMGGVAMCPFMSASVPAVMATSFWTEIAIALATVVLLAAAAGTSTTDSRRKFESRLREAYRLHGPPSSFLDSVIRLISQGVLHPRIFAL